MTTLRNSLFTDLHIKTVLQFISINQRHPAKKCPDNREMHFSPDHFVYINQLVKEYKNTADNILPGRLDNNYYEGERPHN